MASPGNQHCANCIGTLSFPIRSHPQRSGTRIVLRDTIKGGVRNVTRSHAHRLAWMLRDKRPTSCARSAPAVDWGIPACTRLRRNFPGRLRLSLSGREGGPTSRPPSIAAFIRDSERRPCPPRMPEPLSLKYINGVCSVQHSLVKNRPNRTESWLGEVDSMTADQLFDR